MCTGELGNSPSSGIPLHYKGSKFTRIYKDYLIQGGDYTRGDGKGGESIYPGNYFPDENYLHEHSGPGTLAMVNVIGMPDSNTSQFFISLSQEPLTHLNGKNVVFGKLKSGAEILQELNHLGSSSDDGTPRVDIVISDCGLCDKPTPRFQADPTQPPLTLDQELAAADFKLDSVKLSDLMKSAATTDNDTRETAPFEMTFGGS